MEARRNYRLGKECATTPYAPDVYLDLILATLKSIEAKQRPENRIADEQNKSRASRSFGVSVWRSLAYVGSATTAVGENVGTMGAKPCSVRSERNFAQTKLANALIIH